jgi:putative FmdB family regulatory protein
MPIYEYLCRACGHRTEILHGINDPGPNFCPACGAEGTLRKAISAPSVVFKGSGWAKKDRRAVPAGGAKSKASEGEAESSSAAKGTEPAGTTPARPNAKPSGGEGPSSGPSRSSESGGD